MPAFRALWDEAWTAGPSAMGSGERHPELDDVRSGARKPLDDTAREVPVRIARRHEGDQPGPVLAGKRGKPPADTGFAHSSTSSARATAKTSLSPLPHMFMQTM